MIETRSALTVRLTSAPEDIAAAQRLRYRVFVSELGADAISADHSRGREADRYDEVAEHLILEDARRPMGDHVVGVYRLLDEAGAARAGGFYSASEFDLGPLEASGLPMMELGRTCIDRAYRGGDGVMRLWIELARIVRTRRIGLLFGSASFHGTDAAALAQPLTLLARDHLAPEALRPVARGAQCVPLLPDAALDRKAALRQMPALIKAYLRLGGRVGAGVYIDRDFNTTDICLVLETARLSPPALALFRGDPAA